MEVMKVPPVVLKVEEMRSKWQQGLVSTREYHDFVERTKRSLASDRVFRFF